MVLAAMVTVASMVASGFFGYWIHRALHQPWTGPFYRAHMQHHLELYPPGNLTSETYRKAHWYNRGPFLFTPPFIAIVGALALAAWLAGVSLWNVAIPAVVFIGFGYLNDRAHDSFHLRRHWLQRVPFYRRIRRVHFLHHADMTKNFGIVSFEWDHAFGTASERRDK